MKDNGKNGTLIVTYTRRGGKRKKPAEEHSEASIALMRGIPMEVEAGIPTLETPYIAHHSQLIS